MLTSIYCLLFYPLGSQDIQGPGSCEYFPFKNDSMGFCLGLAFLPILGPDSDSYKNPPKNETD